MKTFRIILAAFVLLLILPQAEAQRGGRKTSKRPSSSRSKSKSSKSQGDFVSRLWYGAGGTAGFAGSNGTNQFTVGLIPQVGYKFNEWLSAGPRVGATYTGVKAFTFSNTRERAHLWDFTAAAFARGRVSFFYVQTEFGIISRNYIPNFFSTGRIPLDINLEPATARENEEVFLIGIGYNPSIGGMGSDIGVFYNIFDDVNAISNPITLRFMLTLNY